MKNMSHSTSDYNLSLTRNYLDPPRATTVNNQEGTSQLKVHLDMPHPKLTQVRQKRISHISLSEQHLIVVPHITTIMITEELSVTTITTTTKTKTTTKDQRWSEETTL